MLCFKSIINNCAYIDTKLTKIPNTTNSDSNLPAQYITRMKSIVICVTIPKMPITNSHHAIPLYVSTSSATSLPSAASSKMSVSSMVANVAVAPANTPMQKACVVKKQIKLKQIGTQLK